MNTQTAIKSVDLEKFLVRASAIIKAIGYVSNSEVKYTDKKSTAMLALEWADDMKPREIISLTFDSSDKITGKEVAEWMKSLDSSKYPIKDYMHNLAYIGFSGLVTEQMAGYAASAIKAFEKEKTKGADVKQGSTEMAAALGQVGTKIYGIKVVYVAKSQFDSRFGVCHKYQFESVVGNHKITWMTSTDLPNLTIGSSFTLDGTIKEYSTYRGKHECQVTRAKLRNG
jgi:hypothetical protein